MPLTAAQVDAQLASITNLEQPRELVNLLPLQPCADKMQDLHER